MSKVIRPAAMNTSGSFSRSTTKTYIGSDGLLKTAPVNVPAFQYDPSNLSAAPLPVLELAAKNLLSYPRNFDSASWSKQNSKIIPKTVLGPDGLVSGSKIVEDTANALHKAYQTVTTTNTAPISESFILMAGERSTATVLIQESFTFARYSYVTFDLAAGTASATTDAGGAGSSSANIKPLGGGWYQCKLTTTLGGVNTQALAQVIIGGINAYTGDGTSGLYLWHGQLEASSNASSVIPDGTTFTSRASSKWEFNSAGVLTQYGTDVAVTAYDPATLISRGLSLENAATNYIRNSTMVGAAAGTPGTLPTNWATVYGAGITQTVVGSGAEDGIDYVDIRFSGTPSVSSFINVTPDIVTASSGQTWSGSFFARLISGSFTNTAPFIEIRESDSGGGFLTNTVTGISISSGRLAVQRFQQARTLTNASTAQVTVRSIFQYTSGLAIDFTIRIGLPQLEQGSVATSPIKTSSGAVTRAADVSSSPQMTRAADVITGTGLIYSSAPEVAPAIYAGGTTYGLGDQVSVDTGAGGRDVYESLQASNIGHTPASSPTWWAKVGSTYQTYSSGTTYALGDYVIDSTAHLVYRSVLAGSNLGNPLTDTTKWFNAGATNRWAAFDDVVGTSVSQPTAVKMLIVPGAIDAMGLLNISANSLAVAVVDPATMTTAYSQITDLTNDTSISDYDLYFFEEAWTVSDVYTDALPPYYSGVMSVALTSNGTASLGVAKFGNEFDLGDTEYSPRVGFISYSKKVTDADGNTSVSKGANSKRMTLTTMIDNTKVDKTVRVMMDLDAVPTVWAGAENFFGSMIQFAFIKDFEVEIKYPNYSLCSFQHEGLI